MSNDFVFEDSDDQPVWEHDERLASTSSSGVVSCLDLHRLSQDACTISSLFLQIRQRLSLSLVKLALEPTSAMSNGIYLLQNDVHSPELIPLVRAAIFRTSGQFSGPSFRLNLIHPHVPMAWQNQYDERHLKTAGN